VTAQHKRYANCPVLNSGVMSPIGPKQTSKTRTAMSAFGGKRTSEIKAAMSAYDPFRR
jgi:hypothetical protein